MKKEHFAIIGDFFSIFQQLVTADFNIAISDTEKIITAMPGKTINLKLLKGDKLKEGSVALEAISSRRAAIRLVPREVYGVPYIGRAIPLFDDNGTIIGSIIAAESTEAKENLVKMAQNLTSTIEQITANMEENALGLEKVAGLGYQMEKVSEVNLKSVNETDKIVDTVNNIALQTKLLGLNASIESARAGEAGRSFKVVATEMGVLSESSSKAITQISDLLENLKFENEKVSKQSQELAHILSQLAASTEEVSASTHSLSQMAEELVNMAEGLI